MKITFALFILLLVGLNYQILQAQGKTSKNKQEVLIKTSSECDMCKIAIEEGLAFTKGVKFAELTVETKIAKIIYNPKKTNVAKLKEAISKIGYDADEVLADPKAYEALPECCKKGAHDPKQ